MISTPPRRPPILYNPHVDDLLGEPPHFKYLKRRALKKYGFFLEGLCKRDTPFEVLVDGTISAFIPSNFFCNLPRFVREWIARAEFQAWIRINGLSHSQIKLIDRNSDLGSRDLLAFSYKAATEGFQLRISTLRRFRNVVMHLSHYFVSSRLKSENIRRLDNVILAGDSDPSENEYFQRYFDWYNRPFLVLPFSVGDRFHFGRQHLDRHPECLATGTFHRLEEEEPRSRYKDYRQVTELNTFHPVRREIYERRKELAGSVFCLVAPYRDYGNRSRLRNLIDHFRISQKKYFSIDIVEEYGKYRFAVVGEEASGFPALGALEAIACGAILIAQPSFYSGLDLNPGEHFIQYDGTVSGLLKIISEPWSIEKLDRIANDASEFVQTHFGKNASFDRWIQTLATL